MLVGPTSGKSFSSVIKRGRVNMETSNHYAVNGHTFAALQFAPSVTVEYVCCPRAGVRNCLPVEDGIYESAEGESISLDGMEAIQRVLATGRVSAVSPALHDVPLLSQTVLPGWICPTEQRFAADTRLANGEYHFPASTYICVQQACS